MAMARDIIAEILRATPGVSKEAAFEIFRTEVAKDDHAQRNVAWYFFVNMYDEIKLPAKQRAPSRRTGPDVRHSAEAAVQEAEVIKQKLQLMHLTMPNGKELCDCTGAELATFGNRFKTLADRVGKTRKVGDVLTEQELQATFQPTT